MEIKSTSSKNAKRAILALKLILAFEIVFLLLHTYMYFFIENMGNMGIFSFINLYTLKKIIYYFVFVSIAASIFCAIMFLSWFKKAYSNLEDTSDELLNYTNSETITSWFIPIVSLYKPFAIMDSLFNESSNLIKKYELEHKYNLKSTPIAIWWMLWIVLAFLNAYLFLATLENSGHYEVLLFLSKLEILSSAISLCCGLLLIEIIKNYNQVSPAIDEIFEAKFGSHNAEITEK